MNPTILELGIIFYFCYHLFYTIWQTTPQPISLQYIDLATVLILIMLKTKLNQENLYNLQNFWIILAQIAISYYQMNPKAKIYGQSYNLVCQLLITMVTTMTAQKVLHMLKAKRIPEFKGQGSKDPIFGDLLEVGKAGSLHQFLVENHKKYGPIFQFQWQSEKVVSIGDMTLLQKTTKSLFDRPVSLFALFEPLIGKHSIQYQNGQTGKNRRNRYWKLAFNQQMIDRQGYSIFQQCINEVVKEQILNLNNSNGIFNFCFSIALFSTIQMAFSQGISQQECKEIEELYYHCWGEMEKRMKGDYGSTKEEQRKRLDQFNQNLGVFRQKAKKVYQESLKNQSSSGSFIDLLKEERYDGLSEEDHLEFMMNEIITAIIGGGHTTANSFIWLIYFLAKNPQKQRNLQEELDKCLKELVIPTSEAYQKCDYLQNCINETLRLSSLAPWAARIDPDNAIHLPDGKVIPKNTPIIQPLGKLLLDEQLWEDVDDFIPERFMQSHPQYQPFGFSGGRICPGRAMALKEVGIIGAWIFRNYEITLKDKNFEAEKEFGLVTSPKSDFGVIVKKRYQENI